MGGPCRETCDLPEPATRSISMAKVDAKTNKGIISLLHGARMSHVGIFSPRRPAGSAFRIRMTDLPTACPSDEIYPPTPEGLPSSGDLHDFQPGLIYQKPGSLTEA